MGHLGSMDLLHYRAGSRALRRLRERGFGPEALRVLVAPAAGPKWLVVMGMDQALIAGGYLQGNGRRTLLGSSAGAWRSFALAARNPAKVHRALCDDYVDQRFSARDNAETISQAYRQVLGRVFSDEDVAHALSHPDLCLGLWAARARGMTGADSHRVQWGALGVAALLNTLSGRSQGLFFERTLFTPSHSRGPAIDALRGRRAPLTADNARSVLLASGSVPLVMAAIRNLPGAPAGRYLDGGLTDYHISQPLDCGDRGVALLLLHQARIVPNWFDKWLPYRKPKAAWLRDVLVVHPSKAWIQSLPGEAIPTREDFTTFRDDADERIRRWREAVKRSEQLGEQLLSDATAGRIPDLARPF